MTENKRLEKVVAAIGVATTAWTWYSKGREWYDNKTRYTATLNENSWIYNDMLEWLQEQVKPRSVSLSATNHGGVSRRYNAGGENTVNVGGYSVRFRLDSPAKRLTESALDYVDESSESFLKKIVFTAHDPRAIDALVRHLENMVSARETRPRRANFYTIGQYGWENITPSRRHLDTVFLPRGEKESLVADFDNFFRSEERFRAMGLPWHRGYLFYGPPGNGKSSLAKAVVEKYRLNLYNLPLSGVKDDSHLQNLFASLEPRSVLLLEDIDVFTRSTQREQQSALTLAGILNCLDGVGTPHGLVTIMTTNHLETLDDAMVRAGRVDYKLSLDAPVDEQVIDMFHFIYDEPLGFQPRKFKTMADLTDVFKRNPYDAESARTEIKNEWVVYND